MTTNAQAVPTANAWVSAVVPTKTVPVLACRGKRYLTLVDQIDDHRRRLRVGSERKAATLHAFFDWLDPARSAAPRFVCSDVWKADLTVIGERAGHAVYTLDRFHIMAHLFQAIDAVRAAEARKRAALGRAPVLKRPERLSDEPQGRLRELVRRNVRTVRAYPLKEDFQRFWGYLSPYWAGRVLDRWCTRAMC